MIVRHQQQVGLAVGKPVLRSGANTDQSRAIPTNLFPARTTSVDFHEDGIVDALVTTFEAREAPQWTFCANCSLVALWPPTG
jgi:hypothetical protein